jgi:hypothetical protein
MRGDWIKHECMGGRDWIETSASAAAAASRRSSSNRGTHERGGGECTQGVRTSAGGMNEHKASAGSTNERGGYKRANEASAGGTNERGEV